MDKKTRVWLVVLAFLLIVVLGMCVFFKLKLDEANARCDTVDNENPDVADATEVPGAEYEPEAGSEDNMGAADTADVPNTPEYTPEEVQVLTEELEASKAREAELETEVATLQVEVDAYRAKEMAAEANAEQTAEEPDETGIETQKNEETTFDIEAIQTENSELVIELDAALAENELLDSELDAVKAENEGLNTEIDTIQSENERLSSELETVKAENVSLSEEIETVRGENAALNSELSEANLNNEELMVHLDEALAENLRLEDELDIVYSSLAHTDVQLQAYRSDAEYELSDVINIASDGVSAEYTYVCTAAEGNTVVCELSVDDMTVFASDKMVSGDSFSAFELNVPLSSGSCEALLTVITYRQDNSIASRITMPVMVVVQE